jgi:hypothetical protein
MTERASQYQPSIPNRTPDTSAAWDEMLLRTEDICDFVRANGSSQPFQLRLLASAAKAETICSTRSNPQRPEGKRGRAAAHPSAVVPFCYEVRAA